MAIVVGIEPSAATLAASTQAEGSQGQPARLLLSALDHGDGLNSALAASAVTLLSSVACRGIVGVDASDIWSAIGGPSPGAAIHAVADRGQGAAAFGRSVVSAACEAGVQLRSVRRLLISALLPPGWRLRELDELATPSRTASVAPTPRPFCWSARSRCDGRSKFWQPAVQAVNPPRVEYSAGVVPVRDQSSWPCLPMDAGQSVLAIRRRVGSGR